jgi:hypothetical protein
MGIRRAAQTITTEIKDHHGQGLYRGLSSVWAGSVRDQGGKTEQANGELSPPDKERDWEDQGQRAQVCRKTGSHKRQRVSAPASTVNKRIVHLRGCRVQPVAAKAPATDKEKGRILIIEIVSVPGMEVRKDRPGPRLPS